MILKHIILVLLFCVASFAQAQINMSLKRELDSMKVLDQKYRAALGAYMNGKGDSLAKLYQVKKEDLNDHLWKLQNEIDSSNMARLELIISQYGYPGISLVGNSTNETAFYIIQHSQLIDKYLPIVKEAAEKKELRFQLYAMMLDRWLMFQDKEQVYGTQVSGISVKNPATGAWEPLTFIWPIKDPATVNDRRKAAGFETTIEESAKSFQIEFRHYSLDQILKWRSEVLKAGTK